MMVDNRRGFFGVFLPAAAEVHPLPVPEGVLLLGGAIYPLSSSLNPFHFNVHGKPLHGQL